MITFIRKAIIIGIIPLIIASGASAMPYTISKPGRYKLPANKIVKSGDGIVITASNVTLDMQGFTVSTEAPGTGRGIVVQGGKGVVILGGQVTGFNANVAVLDSQNVRVKGITITGEGLAPNNGPTEIGIMLINSRSCDINDNAISSVNLGIFVRGEHSTGNRIMKNIVTGGATPANNLLGICYNPAPAPAGGAASPAGPRGDNVYNNTITRFGYAIAVSEGSISNMFIDNVTASFVDTFRQPQFFEPSPNGTNVAADNTGVIIPSTTIP